MPALRIQALVAVVLGVLSLAALGVTYLALTNIAHGEPDVVAEWAVVQISAPILLAFIVVALHALVRILRHTD